MKKTLAGIVLAVGSFGLMLLAAMFVVGALGGCGLSAPSKTEITCQKGFGTCFVVHCGNRELNQCQSYFHNWCSKGFADSHYGMTDPRDGSYDRLVECK